MTELACAGATGKVSGIVRRSNLELTVQIQKDTVPQNNQRQFIEPEKAQIE
jgi:hypothetical protein